MPSAFSHAFSAIALGSAFRNKKSFSKMIIIGAVCSVIPDLDVIAFQFGIPYASMWGHRGITHSFFFAFLLSLIVMWAFYKSTTSRKEWIVLYIYFFSATALHPLLDALTNGGLGVALFSPFNNERYFFSYRPISVSPVSISGFFTERGWRILKSEFFWIWIPSIAFLLVNLFIRKSRRNVH
jgi:inner membrane protein